MSTATRLTAAAGWAVVLALSVAMAPAVADVHDDKPVADKLEFIEAADGIKPFGLEDLEPSASGLMIELPEAYAWSLISKDEKEPLAEPME